MNGLEIRAEMDSANTKALLLINGGAAVAFLAFLPYVLTQEGMATLARSILYALLFYQGGLVLAIWSNRARRVCSLVYESANATSPAGHPSPCRPLLGFEFTDPCICLRATAYMWVSLFMFVAGGLIVFFGGLESLSGPSLPAVTPLKV